MEKCKKTNKTNDQIIMEFGTDDMEKCNSCDNLKYRNGIMVCTYIENLERNDD